MRIFAARRDEVNEGFVWLNRPSLPSRCVVQIKNPAQSKSVFCEALQIDDNFLREYNSDSHRVRLTIADDPLVIGGWFRAQLGGLVKQREYELQISPCNNWWGKLCACFHHPQVMVRVGAWLGVIGVFLGLMGVVLGVVGLLPYLKLV